MAHGCALQMAALPAANDSRLMRFTRVLVGAFAGHA